MSDDEDDPFERLGESVEDRDGDPFEQFEDVEDRDESDAESEGGDDGDETWIEDPMIGEKPAGDYDAHDVTPADNLDEETPEPSGGEADVVEQETPSIDTGAGDLDEAFGDVGERAGDPFEDDVFEKMDVGELDPDEVWESISEAEKRGSVSERAERTYAEVSKHRYCEQCEFFSDPPDVECTHEGTEILEFLDQETVRVVDCPIVAERKELEKHE